jgi:hypothetical protein
MYKFGNYLTFVKKIYMKIRYTISVAALFCTFILNGQLALTIGDANDNTTRALRIYNDQVVIVGSTSVNGQVYGTITQINKINGEIVWQKRLDFQSQINAVEIVPPSDPTGTPSILIVGHTMPFFLTDTKSFMANLDFATGNINSKKMLSLRSREGLSEIIRHKNPIDPAFPYYITGFYGSTSSSSSTLDRSFLMNTNGRCNNSDIKFVVDYEYTTSPQDDELAFGSTDLADGNILIMGNSIEGTLLCKVNGSNGNVLSSRVFNLKGSLFCASETNNGDILIGERYFNPDGNSAGLFLLNKTLDVKPNSSWLLPKIDQLYDMTKTANQKYILAGNYKTSSTATPTFPVFLEFELVNNQLTISKRAVFDTDANLTYPGIPFANSENNDYYFLYSKKNVGGSADMLLKKFSASTNFECSAQLDIALQPKPISNSSVAVKTSNFVLVDAQMGGVINTNYTSIKNCLSVCGKNPASVTDTVEYKICGDDSIKVNNFTYYDAGTYAQTLVSSTGCDSILQIVITESTISNVFISENICKGSVFTYENMTYTTEGKYEIIKQTTLGCDSIITIDLKVTESDTTILPYSLCENETVVINDQTYGSAGTYFQNLKTNTGCDSILVIIVNTSMSVKTDLNFSLCKSPNLSVAIGSQVYNKAGRYTQVLTAQSGCDSILNIKIIGCNELATYDFEKCDANNPQQSMIYDEFDPSFLSDLNCTQMKFKNISIDNPSMQKHSCTPGFNNSIAMCVSASSECQSSLASAKPIKIEFDANPLLNNDFYFSQLSFYHKSPAEFNWINGPSGLNNFPQKFKLSIFKNNQEIYQKDEISTSNTWTEHLVNFDDIPDFSTEIEANYRIEILPYCTIGNLSSVIVWDIDNVKIFGSCLPSSDQRIVGNVNSANKDILDFTEVIKTHNNIQAKTVLNSNGQFTFSNNDPSKVYTISAYNDSNCVSEVSALDLVIVQNHILGLKPFESPLQYLAADVNNDQKVTASDLLEMRKLILGITQNFKNNSSWIFIEDKEYDDLSDPWSINQIIEVGGGNIHHKVAFKAIKVGDLSGL